MTRHSGELHNANDSSLVIAGTEHIKPLVQGGIWRNLTKGEAVWIHRLEVSWAQLGQRIHVFWKNNFSVQASWCFLRQCLSIRIVTVSHCVLGQARPLVFA